MNEETNRLHMLGIVFSIIFPNLFQHFVDASLLQGFLPSMLGVASQTWCADEPIDTVRISQISACIRRLSQCLSKTLKLCE